MAVPATAAGELTADDRFTFDMLTEDIESLLDCPGLTSDFQTFQGGPPRGVAQLVPGAVRVNGPAW